jgi:NACHT domain-containing protein
VRIRRRTASNALVGVSFTIVLGVAINTIQLRSPWTTIIWCLVLVLFLGSLLRVDSQNSTLQLDVNSELESATEKLARTIKQQWLSEEDRRKVHDPRALSVAWHAAPEQLFDHPANIRRNSTKPSSTLARVDQWPSANTIHDLYRSIPSGRLVILGKKGSGKTVLASRLAIEILEARAPTDPVPVIFGLSSWDPDSKSLNEWLTQQLSQHYIESQALASALLDTGAVLPILDGFDEISSGLHRHALEVLNNSSAPLVLTSRRDRFQSAVEDVDVLSFAAGIELNDLTINDLRGYLPFTTRRTTPHGLPLWTPVLEYLELAPSNNPLATVLTTPLMVFLARKIYSDLPGDFPTDLIDATKFNTVDSIEKHLLSKFVSAAYETIGSNTLGHRLSTKGRPLWNISSIESWLGFLAKSLPSGDLAWWELGDTVRRPARTLLFGCVYGLLTGIVAAFVVGPLGGVTTGVAGAAGGGIIGYYKGRVPRRVRLQVSGRARTVIRKLSIGLTFGIVSASVGWLVVTAWGWLALMGAGALGGGLAGGIGGWLRRQERAAVAVGTEVAGGTFGGFAGGFVIGLVGWLAEVPVGAPIPWLELGIAIGLGFGLVDAFDAPIEIETVVGPLELIATSRSYTIFQSAMVGLVYILIIGYMLNFKSATAGGITIGLLYGMAINPWGRWLLVVRFWLPLTGRLPWRVAAFLQDAHHREVLRQSGAVYQFRHERLQNYLATSTMAS